MFSGTLGRSCMKQARPAHIDRMARMYLRRGKCRINQHGGSPYLQKSFRAMLSQVLPLSRSRSILLRTGFPTTSRTSNTKSISSLEGTARSQRSRLHFNDGTHHAIRFLHPWRCTFDPSKGSDLRRTLGSELEEFIFRNSRD